MSSRNSLYISVTPQIFAINSQILPNSITTYSHISHQISFKMAIDLSFTEQVEMIMLAIFSEKIVVLENFGYEGLNPMFEPICQCDGFFNIILAKPVHFMPRHVTQFSSYIISVDADPASVTFCLEVQEKQDLPIPVLPLVLQACNLANV